MMTFTKTRTISTIVLFITDAYMRPGRKIAQTGMKSSRSLDRSRSEFNIHLGLNVKKKYISDRLCSCMLRNDACSQSTGAREINWQICDFHTGLVWTYWKLPRFDFIPARLMWRQSRTQEYARLQVRSCPTSPTLNLRTGILWVLASGLYKIAV
jgi:hypothetical protein